MSVCSTSLIIKVAYSYRSSSPLLLKRYQNKNFSIFTFCVLWKVYPRGLKSCGTDLKTLCCFVKNLQLSTLNQNKETEKYGILIGLEITLCIYIYCAVLNYFVIKCLEAEKTYSFCLSLHVWKECCHGLMKCGFPLGSGSLWGPGRSQSSGCVWRLTPIQST